MQAVYGFSSGRKLAIYRRKKEQQLLLIIFKKRIETLLLLLFFLASTWFLLVFWMDIASVIYYVSKWCTLWECWSCAEFYAWSLWSAPEHVSWYIMLWRATARSSISDRTTVFCSPDHAESAWAQCLLGPQTRQLKQNKKTTNSTLLEVVLVSDGRGLPVWATPLW